MVLGFLLFEVLINRIAHGRIELFGAETVSSADNFDIGNAFFEESGANVEVKGFTEGAGFFGSVENSDLLAGLRQSSKESIGYERTIETDFYETDFMAFFVHLVDGFFHSVSAAAHNDNNVFSIGSTAVIEQMIISAGELGHFVHHFLNDSRGCEIILVRGLPVLEISIAVLSRTFLDRVLRVECAFFEIIDIIHIDEGFHFVVIDHVDLGNFVRSSETVKEMQERHFCFEGREVCNEREIHNFLNGTGSEHCKTGLAASHNVLMIAENIEGMSGDSTCADVEYGRHQFARDLVHVRDHEQKTLACSVSSGESACRKGTVNGTCSAAFGLHFGKSELLAEHVYSACGSPFVCNFRHRRRRSNGVDGRNFREGISDVAGGGIAVNRHLLHTKNNLRIQ